MKILFNVAIILSALAELFAAGSLIGGPAGISAAGSGEMWSMHYGFAALAIASLSIWIWPHRDNLAAVTVALGVLVVFHVGVCASLAMAGDQAGGMILHGVLAAMFITLFARSKSLAE